MQYSSKMHIPHTNFHLATQLDLEPYKKSPSLYKRNRIIFWLKKSGEWASEWQYRKNKRTRQKNTTEDRKGDLNDSSEIPDKKMTTDIPSLLMNQNVLKHIQTSKTGVSL